MAHSVTGRLNKSARQHKNQSGVTFFVTVGEKNYNHKTKQAEWTNYDAALFAKDTQVQFYTDNLVENAIISVSGTGLLIQQDPSGQYEPKLILQDAKLEFVANDLKRAQQHQQGVSQARQAMQPAPPPQNQPMGAHQQAPAGFDDFDQKIPF